MASDLGDYLKARRAHIQPADVGLDTSGRRRVLGLRREEVAMLVGVSVDYYTRLEQGRETHPSPSVLDGISHALRLDADQRGYIFRLAGLAPKSPNPPAMPLPPAMRDLLDAWSETPAMVIDRQLNVLTYNPLAAALHSSFARIDNLVRMIFLDPAGKEFYTDWDRAAESCIASLRLALSYATSTDDVRRLVIETSAASTAFRALWARAHEVRGKTHAAKSFHHDAVGELTLDHHAFEVRGTPGLQLIVYRAAPSSTSEEKLRLLASLHATERLPRG